MNTKTRDKHDVGKTEHVYRKILHIMELIIAGFAILVLIGALVLEVYGIFTTEGYFEDLNHFLHNILTIVVGLEFVRMLIGIICIAALFATRRFLIPRSEMTEDLVELE